MIATRNAKSRSTYQTTIARESNVASDDVYKKKNAIAAALALCEQPKQNTWNDLCVCLVVVCSVVCVVLKCCVMWYGCCLRTCYILYIFFVFVEAVCAAAECYLVLAWSNIVYFSASHTLCWNTFAERAQNTGRPVVACLPLLPFEWKVNAVPVARTRSIGALEFTLVAVVVVVVFVVDAMSLFPIEIIPPFPWSSSSSRHHTVLCRRSKVVANDIRVMRYLVKIKSVYSQSAIRFYISCVCVWLGCV